MPTIVTKYSTTAGSAPTAGGMTLGELAVNVTDKKLYTKDNGGNIVTVGGDPAGSWTLILTQTASASSALDFINGTNGVSFNNTYDEYLWVLDRIKPGTDGDILWLRTTTDATNFDVGASNYRFSYITTAGADVVTTNTRIALTEAVGNVATSEVGVSGIIRMTNPETATPSLFTWHLAAPDASTALQTVVGSGWRDTAADIDGVRFMFSTGTMASGTISMYGRRK